MILAKKVTDEAGMVWWLFFGKDSEESPLMIMSGAQAQRFVEEYERELEEEDE